jgi:hypothetical protein
MSEHKLLSVDSIFAAPSFGSSRHCVVILDFLFDAVVYLDGVYGDDNLGSWGPFIGSLGDERQPTLTLLDNTCGSLAEGTHDKSINLRWYVNFTGHKTNLSLNSPAELWLVDRFPPSVGQRCASVYQQRMSEVLVVHSRHQFIAVFKERDHVDVPHDRNDLSE